MDLLSLPHLLDSVSTLKTASRQSPGFCEIHRQLVARFATTVIQKIAKLPEVPDKIGVLRHRVREALLLVDLQKGIWYYRHLILKLDKIIMEMRGYVPVGTHPTQEQVNNVAEYLDRTESAAWALWYE
jgi:hypothetical protein